MQKMIQTGLLGKLAEKGATVTAVFKGEARVFHSHLVLSEQPPLMLGHEFISSKDWQWIEKETTFLTYVPNSCYTSSTKGGGKFTSQKFISLLS